MKIVLKLSCITALVLIILSTGFYFLITNSYFIKSYLLPAISSATGVRITTNNVKYMPFTSRFILRDFTVRSSFDNELKGKTADCTYSFWDLLEGNIKINHLSLGGLVVRVKTRQRYFEGKYKNPVLRRRLDVKQLLSQVNFEVHNLSVKNSEVNLKSEKRDKDNIFEFKLYDLNIFCRSLKELSKSQISYSFSFKANKGEKYQFHGNKVSGLANCFIGKDWSSIQLGLNTDFDNVSGITRALRFNDKRLQLDLLFDYVDNKFLIKKFSFKDLSLKGEDLANIDLTGRGSLNPFAADINFKKCLLTSNFLDIIGVLYGADFGQTGLNYSGSFSFARNSLKSEGILGLSNFSVSKGGFNFFADNQFNVFLRNNINFNFARHTIEANDLDLTIKSKNKKLLDLSLSKKLWLKLADEKSGLQIRPPAVKLNVHNFDLSILENLGGRYLGIKLLKGALNSDLETSLGENNSINIKGNVDVSKLDLMYKNWFINNLDLSQNVDAKLIDFEKLLLNKAKTMLSSGGKEVAQLRTNGKIGFNTRTGNINLKIDNFFIAPTSEVPTSIFKNTLGIKTLFLDGFVNYTYTQGGKNFTIDTNLRGDNLSLYDNNPGLKLPVLSSNIEAQLVKNNNELDIKKITCNLAGPKFEKLGHIKVKGKWFLRPESERSKLQLLLEGLDLKKLSGVFNNIEEGPLKINLKNQTFDADWLIQNVTFGPYLKIDSQATANMNNGFLKVEPLTLSLNSVPLTGTIKYDFNADENNYFYVSAKASNMSLSPLLSALYSPFYSTSQGAIKSFSLEMEGNGFSTVDLERDLKGQLKASFDNISIPDNTGKYDYMRLFFIPIEVFGRIQRGWEDFKTPLLFDDLIQYSRDIFSRSKNLNLSDGNINLVAKNGKINIVECSFKGDGNPLSKLKMRGSLGFDRSLDVNTLLKLNNGISVPLRIGGTVSRPRPNLLGLRLFMQNKF